MGGALLALSLLLAVALAAAIFYIVRIRRALAQDIARRDRSETREKYRSQVLELLAQGAPLPRILKAIARRVEEERPGLLCSILLLDAEGRHLYTGAAPSLPDYYNDAVTGAEIGLGVGSFGTAAFTGQRVIVEDIQVHPYWAE